MSGSRPNIVLIVSDDHGYADRSRLGKVQDVATPALDELSASGVECSQAYVAAPICSPSRAALISGCHPGRWGVEWFETSRFPDHLPSLAERLKDQGYATGYLGKVHYGPEEVGDRATPPGHGFDTTFYGLAGQQMGRLNYLRHSQVAVAEYGELGAVASAVQPMLEGHEPVDFEGFLTEELGRRAEEFVTGRGESEQPFFLMLAFNAVHNFCWQLPKDELVRRGLPTHSDFTGTEKEYLDWYDGQISPNLEHGRDYYVAQLELMDREIGRVLSALDETGQRDNTLVIYLTDNGGSTCNFADNAPLRGTKYTLWEGGIRVPFVLHWPGGGLQGGSRYEHVVSSMDLFPTILAAAGAPPSTWEHCDGQDLLAQLQGEVDAAARSLHWDNGFQWAVRDGDWKLLWTDGDSGAASWIRTVEHAEPGSGLRLFDVQRDPSEETDLARTHPQTVAEVLALHDAWREEVFDSAASTRSAPTTSLEETP